MASPSPGIVRSFSALVSIFLVVFVMGRPILWYLRENSYAQASCPTCDCDCSSDIYSTPLGVLDSSYADCGKDDPEMNREMEKDTLSLLSEELTLQKNVTDDSLGRTKALIIDAERISSHYRKEAEKCNAGMEICEEAREKAEAALIEERNLSALWERRAREHGWKDQRRFL